VRLNKALGLDFTQSEVDFVVPDLERDLPLCIDPFLLYKSKDPALRQLHETLLGIFGRGVEHYRAGRRADLDRLIVFPEAPEIGFGYTQGGTRGSGLGLHLNSVLAETLAASEALQERGLRHVEELQLVSTGVGPDRVGDIAANVLKSYLVDYTQKQAALWGIPLAAGMPVAHYYDAEDGEWADGYFDLPRNPVTGGPVLLVPRRVVRLLPWINYEDYVRSDFGVFLPPKPPSRMPGSKKPRVPTKPEVVRLTRGRLDVLDQYISRKERESSKAEPALGDDPAAEEADRRLVEDFIARLDALPTGQAASKDYQRLMFEVLNFLFEPDLTDGEMEVGTFLGTERRDIVYGNEAERSFWAYVRSTYRSPLVMFETKNVDVVEIDHVTQVATYLGARLGMLGFILARNPPGDNIIRKTYSIHNDTPGMPRKVILILHDEDVRAMLRGTLEGNSPVQYVQRAYRDFFKKVQ
jgi:hypothetical protein